MPEFENGGRLKSGWLRPGGKISRRELLKLLWRRSEMPPAVAPEAVSRGWVVLDSSQCTGCGLCALNCATAALTAASDAATDAYQLLFKPDVCGACGQCVAICPENCLSLEKIPDSDAPCRTPVVLFGDVMVRCRQCGSVIGARAMLHNLSAKVVAAGHAFPARLALCPDCQIKVQFGLAAKELVPREDDNIVSGVDR